jgi:hypothetical protein
VRVDLLAIAAQKVERGLKPMPSFPALVAMRRSSPENRVHATAWPPGGASLDIDLHYGVDGE